MSEILTKNFTSDEFACKNCCNQSKIDSDFIKMLQKAREIANIPFCITSGYRCLAKQEKLIKEGLSGVGKLSSHCLGKAADILVKNSRDRFIILVGLLSAGFNRIGIGKDFIHVDTDKNKDQQVLWNYYKKV